MCNPAIALMAVSFVASAAQTISQNRAAKQDYKNQVAANQVAVESAAEDRNFQLDALKDQRDQLRTAAAEDTSDAARAAATLRARQLVASSEQGGLGNTAAALVRDVDFQSGVQFTRIDENLKRDLRQNRREGHATISRTANRAKSLPRPTKPSSLAAGLTIAGSALSTGLSMHNASK